jgi:hypothetical protein
VTKVEVAPELLEEAVFQCASRWAERGDPRALEWFEARERLYELKDGAERERAFAAHALDLFRRAKLDEPLRAALESCPATARGLDVLFVRRARRAKDERAELYRAASAGAEPGPTRAVLALRPEQFLDVERLHAVALRELLYVDDMLDERFGYAPDAIDARGLDPGPRDVARERVGRAWAARVLARARGEEAPETFGELVERALASMTLA